ncbi:MAG: fatty acid desaturase [Ilumatobacteraceae bacterium]
MLHTLLVAFLAGLVVTLLANFCTTIYLHRCLSHRALAVRGPVHQVFRFLVWITTGVQPRQWVAVHRKHHAFTDVEGDPHSPVLLGWVTVQVRNVALYRAEARNPETVNRYAKDMSEDRLDRVLYDHGVLGLAVGTTILCLVLGPVTGLLAAFIHLNLLLGSNAAVNAMAHHFGRKPYDNGAGNLQWLAFLTGGEGLHNNHHAAPTSAKLSHRWYEVDPGWWIIKTLSVFGLAKVRLGELRLKDTAATAATRAAQAANTAKQAAANAAHAASTKAHAAAEAVTDVAHAAADKASAAVDAATSPVNKAGLQA